MLIKKIKRWEMKKINVLSLFDGMSCGYQALKESGISVGKYYASEIDKNAIIISKKNHPDVIQLGDIRDISKKDFDKIDLLIGGSPCQDLSICGKKTGLEGSKSSLFFQYIRLKKEIRPKWFLLENVKPARRVWKELMDEVMGVKGKLINSDLFVCQSRPRIYWTNIKIKPLPVRPNWQREYWTDSQGKLYKRSNGVCGCLTTGCVYKLYNKPEKKLENRITCEQAEELQGLPIRYTEGVSKTARSKMIGNGWTIPVIKHIFEGLVI